MLQVATNVAGAMFQDALSGNTFSESELTSKMNAVMASGGNPLDPDSYKDLGSLEKLLLSASRSLRIPVEKVLEALRTWDATPQDIANKQRESFLAFMKESPDTFGEIMNNQKETPHLSHFLNNIKSGEDGATSLWEIITMLFEAMTYVSNRDMTGEEAYKSFLVGYSPTNRSAAPVEKNSSDMHL